MQDKTAVRHHNPPIRMAKMKSSSNKNYMDVEKIELSYHAGGNVKRYSHFGKQFSSFLTSDYTHHMIQLFHAKVFT